MCIKNEKIITARLRELKGDMGVAAFARKCGIKQPVMDRYLRNGYEPKIEQMILICKVHGCTMDWLTGLSDKRTDAAVLRESVAESEWGRRALDAESELRRYKTAFAKLTKSLKCAVEVVEELEGGE